MEDKLTIRGAVEFAVKTEQQGAKLYSWLAKVFATQPELQEIFTTLARDETRHAEKFAALHETMSDEIISESEQEYLKALFHSEVVFLFKNVEKIQDRDEAIERALHLEKSTLLCYEAMKDVLGQNEVLDAIIAEEKKHIVQVMKYLITGAKFRGLSDDHP